MTADTSSASICSYEGHDWHNGVCRACGKTQNNPRTSDVLLVGNALEVARDARGIRSFREPEFYVGALEAHSRVAGVVYAVAGIQDRCCGQTVEPRWCVHDAARAVLGR